MKVQLIIESDELTIITENGGIACSREAEPLSETEPRVSTVDLYEMPLTEIDVESLTDEHNVWCALGEGNMYYEDFEKQKFNSYNVITFMLEWLGVAYDDCEFTSEDLFLEHFKI